MIVWFEFIQKDDKRADWQCSVQKSLGWNSSASLDPLHVTGSAVVLRHSSQLRPRAPGRRVFILWMWIYVLSVASLEVVAVGV